MLPRNCVCVASSDKGSMMAGQLPVEQQFPLETMSSTDGMRGVEQQPGHGTKLWPLCASRTTCYVSTKLQKDALTELLLV